VIKGIKAKGEIEMPPGSVKDYMVIGSKILNVLHNEVKTKGSIL